MIINLIYINAGTTHRIALNPAEAAPNPTRRDELLQAMPFLLALSWYRADIPARLVAGAHSLGTCIVHYDGESEA